MFIPLGTDAPIYYRPVGTIGLIAVNVLVYFYTATHPEAIGTYGLVHGSGVHPLQWLTSNFIHGSFLHLAGNMLFLWGFGLLVEGKLGWQRFVPLYLGIGIVECMVEAALFQHSHFTSFGASAVIFGLMAISLIWAPLNEVTVGYIVFIFIFIRAGTFEISVIWFACLTLLKSVFVIWLLGNNSEVLHLLGAVIGAGVGLALLKWNVVDCERWDLISVIRGKTPRTTGILSHEYQADWDRRAQRSTAQRTTKPKNQRPQKLSGEFTLDPHQHVSELIEQGKVHAAWSEIQKQRHLKPDWSPEPEDMLKLARLLRKWKEWKNAVQCYWEYISAIPQDHRARLEVAEILVLVEERPTAAKKVLSLCNTRLFNPREKKVYKKLIQAADQMIESGVIELEREAW